MNIQITEPFRIAWCRYGLGVALLVLFICSAANAQHAATANFRGDWEWVVYARSRSELPPAYHDSPLREIPAASVYLKIKQRGNKLSGDYSATRRFLAKLEDGSFDAVAKQNTATLELESGFGGKVTVELTLKGARLHWKVIAEEGEWYFPPDVVMRRIRPRRRTEAIEQ